MIFHWLVLIVVIWDFSDIDPENAYSQLEACRTWRIFLWKNVFIGSKIERASEIVSTSNAVNEAVIHPAKIAHMIDFHVYINDKFAFSTFWWINCFYSNRFYGYSSAGGPILTLNLKCHCISANVSHTLTSRPLVVGDSKYRFVLLNLILLIRSGLW